MGYIRKDSIRKVIKNKFCIVKRRKNDGFVLFIDIYLRNLDFYIILLWNWSFRWNIVSLKGIFKSYYSVDSKLGVINVTKSRIFCLFGRFCLIYQILQNFICRCEALWMDVYCSFRIFWARSLPQFAPTWSRATSGSKPFYRSFQARLRRCFEKIEAKSKIYQKSFIHFF